MEGGNGAQGATMSAGTPVSVGSKIGSEAMPQSVPSAEVGNEAVSVPENGPKQQKGQENTNIQEGIKTADKLTETAKSDGVDAAFEELASDDTYNRPPVDGVKSEQGEEEEDTKIPIELQIQELVDKVEKFTEGNSEKLKKLEEAQETNRLAMMSMYEMAEVLRRLIEESESKNKESLLAFLARAINKLLEIMLMDENNGAGIKQSSPDHELEKMAA